MMTDLFLSEQYPIAPSLLNQVLERTINSVVIADARGKIIWVNAGFERMTGYAIQEVVGRSPGSLLQGPETDREIDRTMKRAIAAGKPFTVTVMNYTKTGRKFWNRIECQPLYDAGELNGFLALQMDVTESIAYQNQLLEVTRQAVENSERMTLAFAGGLVGNWDWNPQTNDLYLHESWERLVGEQPNSLPHRLDSWRSRVHPDDLPRVNQILKDVIQGHREGFEFEHRIRSQRAEYRWTICRGRVASRDRQNQPTRVVGVHLDITEQKQAQLMLDEQNALLHSILDVIPFGLSWKDSKDRYMGCNSKFAQEAGYRSPGELIGRTDQELNWTPENLQTSSEDDLRVKETGLPILHKIEQLTGPDGSDRIYDISKSPFRLRDGSLGILGVQIDITELETIRESLRAKEAELRHKGRMEAVGELAGGVSHEFNNLLQAIRGFVSFARDDIPPNTTAYDDLTESLTAINKAVEITQQLLRFSRTEEVTKKATPPLAILNDLRVLLRPLMHQSIHIRYQTSDKLPDVMANSTSLVQAVLNLCVNARDAMPDGGSLTIGVQLKQTPDEADQIVFSVEDTGHGIPEEIRERIFDPFFTTKEIGAGTGLGLPLVYSTVAEHQGKITFESRTGQGTRFEISLPAYYGSRGQTASPAGMDSDVLEKNPLQLPTILLAEDDPIVRRVTVRMLQNLKYHVISATDGIEAVEQYQQYRDSITLLMFDIMMPRKNGPEAYHEICQLAGKSSVPILFCTGYDSDKHMRESILERGYRVLPKPFDQQQLADAVTSTLSPFHR